MSLPVAAACGGRALPEEAGRATGAHAGRYSRRSAEGWRAAGAGVTNLRSTDGCFAACGRRDEAELGRCP